MTKGMAMKLPQLYSLTHRGAHVTLTVILADHSVGQGRTNPRPSRENEKNELAASAPFVFVLWSEMYNDRTDG